LHQVDILYMTCIQTDKLQGEEISRVSFSMQKHLLEHCRKDLKILHPFPRKDEIDPEIDATPFAYYFEQAKNSTPVCMAIIATLLGKTPFRSYPL